MMRRDGLADQQVLTPAALRQWPLPAPEPGGSTHDRGTVLVIGGSRGSPGAVLLAGNAALRAGVGTLQMAGPESVATALAIHVPESLVVALPESAEGRVSGELRDLIEGADCVLIGPGLSGREHGAALVAEVLGLIGPQASAVVDAYALRELTPDVTAPVAGRLVLTPNTGEAADLLGRPAADPGGLAAAAFATARRFHAVVALHGYIADSDGGRWRDQSGHAGLATSGSGDVLAGLVAGLLARGATPAQAACWGTHVHSTSGERLAARIGRLGFLARELLDEAPLVLAELQG